MKCPTCNHEEPIFREDGKMVACMNHKTEEVAAAVRVAVNKVKGRIKK